MPAVKTPGFTQSLLAIAVTAALAAGAWAGFESRNQTASDVPPVATAAAAVPLSARNLPDFSGIVAAQGLAVVNISVTGASKSSALPHGLPHLDPDDPFYEFFKRFQGPKGEAPVHGMGSGFIVSADGIVLTNAHVVADADEVIVKLTDKREFKAKVLGVDKPSDVAVLKINAKGLPTVRIGNPQTTRVGEWVLAIGAPFGFENSATAGIVSAKSRSLPDEGFVPFLQTDVAINPGNSGGPLFNVDGEVIGINSQIYSRSGGYMGLSFAIPIDVAMKVEQQIVTHGKVSRGRLGITIQEVDQPLAESFGLARAGGALVSAVEPGSPAEKAGLLPGDVILKFNGHEIGASSDLPPLVADVVPGGKATLGLWRKGKHLEISSSVMEAKETQAQGGPKAVEPGRLGLAVRPLSAEEKREAELAGGLLVEEASGPAARAGIRPGDVLLAVNGEPITSVEQLRGLVNKSGKRIALLILRDGQKLFVPISLG